MADQPVALLTNTEHFVGGAAKTALLEKGYLLVAQDDSYQDGQDGNLVTTGAAINEQLIDDLVAEYGRLDVLISNDVYPARRAPIDEADADDFRAGLEAMTVMPMRLAGRAAAQMKQQGCGSILFATSAAPLRGLPNYSLYCAARGATNSLALALAQELGRFGIAVNALAPNFVENPTYFPEDLRQNEEAMAKITRQIPLRRLGKPEEVAHIIDMLTDPKAAFLTGQVISLSGGWA